MRLGVVVESAGAGGPRPELGEKWTQEGQRLDDLELIKTIGTGTFGRVILVQEKSSGEYGALKVLALADLIRLNQVEHVKNEKNILASIQNHPFIVQMRWYLKDSSCIYMLFEYVSGGELFTYLRSAGHFSTSTSCFYAAEILLALEYLHERDIVYRDLKPENVLLDPDGHVKILDFGFAKRTRHPCFTICGTPDYLAPEIIQSKGHNKAVDYWALGVLIYEFVVGWPPFHAQDPLQTYERIVLGTFGWPGDGDVEGEVEVDLCCRDLISKLLVADRTRRLGCMRGGVEDVKRHRWFSNIHFDQLLLKRTQGPILPLVRWRGDTSNFGIYPESEPNLPLPPDQLALFNDF